MSHGTTTAASPKKWAFGGIDSFARGLMWFFIVLFIAFIGFMAWYLWPRHEEEAAITTSASLTSQVVLRVPPEQSKACGVADPRIQKWVQYKIPASDPTAKETRWENANPEPIEIPASQMPGCKITPFMSSDKDGTYDWQCRTHYGNWIDSDKCDDYDAVRLLSKNGDSMTIAYHLGEQPNKK